MGDSKSFPIRLAFAHSFIAAISSLISSSIIQQTQIQAENKIIFLNITYSLTPSLIPLQNITFA